MRMSRVKKSKMKKRKRMPNHKNEERVQGYRKRILKLRFLKSNLIKKEQKGKAIMKTNKQRKRKDQDMQEHLQDHWQTQTGTES